MWFSFLPVLVEERLGGKGLLRLMEFVKFVQLVFSVLGSSLLKCAVFHVLSWIDESKHESYREQLQELISPEHPTNHSYGVSCSTSRLSHFENYRKKEVSEGQRCPS